MFFFHVVCRLLSPGGLATRPELVANVPPWVVGEVAACLAERSLFLLSGGRTFCCLQLDTSTWHRLPSPIGAVQPCYFCTVLSFTCLFFFSKVCILLIRQHSYEHTWLPEPKYNQTWLLLQKQLRYPLTPKSTYSKCMPKLDSFL